MKFVKAGERGVQVCLVEKFVAADSIAFDSDKVNHSPLGGEAFWRGPIRRIGDDRAEAAEPMHRLDAGAEVRREVPNGAYGCRQVTRVDRGERPVVDDDPVCRRKFVPVERGGGPRDDRPRVRVGGRFTGEVPSIEFFEGSVDVVEIRR